LTTSFDFHPWKIQARKDRKTPYRVRWIVARRQFGNSFVTMALAESFHASLITAARKGEGFDTDSGLPESLLPSGAPSRIRTCAHGSESLPI
jgi:hypothetical protein